MWILVGIFLGVFGVILLYLLVLLVASLWVKPGKEYEKYSPFYGWLVVSAAAIALFLGRVRVKVSGLEKIPKKGRFLFVCNHLSNYDPVAVSSRKSGGLSLQKRGFFHTGFGKADSEMLFSSDGPGECAQCTDRHR